MALQMSVPFSPWNSVLLLVALACSEASSSLNVSTSPHAQHIPSAGFAASSSEPDERISVFELDYDYVQIPYEVTLWILLASLAKIGKSSNTWFGKLFLHEITYVKILVGDGLSGF
jgi:hypothetical protein